MKFTVNKKELQNALAKMNSIVSKKSYLPILQNVHVKAGDREVAITATNLEHGIKISLPSWDTELGETTVPFGKLLNITKALSNDNISFETVENDKIAISSKKSKYTLSTIDAGDFPAMKDKIEGEVSMIDSETFKSVINSVIFAASNDDSRYNLNTLFFSQYQEKSCVVATDGHRLALNSIDLPNFNMLVPKLGCLYILKMLVKGLVGLYKDTNTLYVKNGNMLITVRLIEGDYPDFIRVLPDSSVASTLVVDNKELLSSVKRVSIMTTDRTKGAIFTVSENELKLYVKDEDSGEAQDSVEIRQTGEDFECEINTSYLFESISHIATSDSKIEYFKAGAPIRFSPTTVGDYFSVVMPMRR